MILTIGSGNENDIILDGITISRNHASIHIKDYKTIILLDNSSKNGVFVNDRKIRKKRIYSDDAISLGSTNMNGNELITEALNLYNKNRKDFSYEFEEILKNLEEFEKKKNQILSNPVFPLIIRLSLGLGIILILIFFPNLIPNDGARIGLIMSVGLVSALTSVLSGSKNKKNEKLDLLKLDFENKLQCPKCHVSYLNYGLTYMKGRGKCPNAKCDVIYNIIK